MTRNQATRRKPQKQRKISVPKLPVLRIGGFIGIVGAITAVVVTFQFTTAMLDRPIRSIEINGPFQRVTALQIEEAINDELSYGFLSADIAGISKKSCRCRG